MDLRRELTLFKLFLFSRFTRPLLVLTLALVAVMYFLYGATALIAHQGVNRGAGLVKEMIVFNSLPVALSVLSRPALTKSDVDFLLALPLDKREIVAGIYLTTLASSGIAYLLLGAFTLLFMGPMSVVVAVLLALFISSMIIVLAPLNLRTRAVISLAMGLWFASPAFGFPFSPLSMFIGYNYAYAMLASLTAVFTYLSFRSFDKVKLISVEGQPQRTEVKEISFGARSPFLAVMRRNLSFLEVGARVNYMGIVAFRSVRVSLVNSVLASVLISVVYYLLVSHLKSVVIASTASVLLVYYLAFIALMLAQSSFMFEPLWLSFNVLGPLTYARYLLLSRTISLELIFAPFAVAEALLGNYPLSLFILAIPLSYIYMASAIARINPMQVRDENAPQVVYSARTFVVSLLALPLLGVAIALTSLSPLVTFEDRMLIGALSLVITALVDLPFLLWRGFWEKVKDKMVENNFV